MAQEMEISMRNHGHDITDYVDPAEFYRRVCASALESGDHGAAEHAAGEAIYWLEARASMLDLLLSA